MPSSAVDRRVHVVDERLDAGAVDRHRDGRRWRSVPRTRERRARGPARRSRAGTTGRGSGAGRPAPLPGRRSNSLAGTASGPPPPRARDISTTRIGRISAWATPESPVTTSPEEFSAAVTAVTTAFGDPTRRDIYLFAREDDNGVTAAEVAERFALHPNVARHHLDKLAAGGYLQVGVEQVHAGAGRPSKRYRASDKEMDARVPGPPRRPAHRPARPGARARAARAGGGDGRGGGPRLRPLARPRHGARRGPPFLPRRAARGGRRVHRPRVRGARRSARRDRWRSSPSSARSGRRRSSTRSSAPSTGAW